MRAGTVVLLAVTAIVFTWALDASGYGNEYYAAAAVSGSRDWTAWLFGSFDAASFISVDKPPLSLWVTGLSVRIFGLSSWSVLLPHALAAIGAVALLVHTVRRWKGPAAGLLAGAMLTTTPIVAVMARYNNPDAILMLVLVAAVAATASAVRTGSVLRLAGAGVLTGLAFLTKTTQAILVVPAIAVVWLVAAPLPLLRRMAGGILAACAAVVTAGWWILLAAVSDAAPYFGQTDSGSFVDYILGVNGLDRLGSAAPQVDPFGGTGGWGRLFNAQVGPQISWLVPLAAVGLAAGLIRLRRADRTDAMRAGWLLWGTLFATHVVVFGLMAGVFHPYYTMSMAPCVAALAAAGSVDLWRSFRRHDRTWWILPATVLATSAWAWAMWSRTPDYLPAVGPAIAACGIVAVSSLLVAGHERAEGPRSLRTVAVVTLAAVLLGPASYAIGAIGTDFSGGDPKAGPATSPGPGTAPPGGLPAGADPSGSGLPPAARAGGEEPPPRPSGERGGRPAPVGAPRQVSDTLVTFLVEHHEDETWLAATVGSGQAATLILATGEPVMAMGGFSGGDPTPTADDLAAYLDRGELRFVILDGGRADRWTDVVTGRCAPVTWGDLGAGSGLYDCGA